MQANQVLIQYFDRITVICVNVVMVSAEDTHPEQTTRGALHKVAKWHKINMENCLMSSQEPVNVLSLTTLQKIRVLKTSMPPFN